MNTINPFIEYLINIPFRGNECIISILLAVALGFISFFVIGTLWGRCWNKKWKLSNHPGTLSIVLLLSLCVVVSGLFYYGSIGCHFYPSVINNEVSKLNNVFTAKVKKICKDEDEAVRTKTLANLEKNPAAKYYRIDGEKKIIDLEESDTVNQEESPIPGLVKVLAEEMMNVADQQLESELSSTIPGLAFLVKDRFNSAQTNGGNNITELVTMFSDPNHELKLPINMSGKLESIHEEILKKFEKAAHENYKIARIAREDVSGTALFLFGTFPVILLLFVAYCSYTDIKSKSTYKN